MSPTDLSATSKLSKNKITDKKILKNTSKKIQPFGGFLTAQYKEFEAPLRNYVLLVVTNILALLGINAAAHY